MNKIISIKLPILALAMAFTISCTFDKDLGENLGSGSVGENSSSSNEQGSSSSFVQSSSSGIPDMCCPHPSCYENQGCSDVCAPPVLVGTEYLCPVHSNTCCPNPSCYENQGCPDVCAAPILVGNEYVCEVKGCEKAILMTGMQICRVKKSSSSSFVQSSSSSVPDDCVHRVCDEFGLCIELDLCQ